MGFITSIHKKGHKKTVPTIEEHHLPAHSGLKEEESRYKEEEGQSGFQAGKSSTGYVFYLKQVIKNTGYIKETHLLFFDLQKA